MISEKSAKTYCSEDISLIENYDKAVADKTQVWHCHHRNAIVMNCSAEELKAKGLYENRPASELIFLTSSEHLSIHTKGVPKSDEQRRKMSEAHKGRRHPHAWSPEAKARSEARREAKRIEILRLFNVIAQYDADGKLVAEHKTVRTAAKALGVSKSGVQKFLAFPTARRSRRKLTGVKLVLEKRYKRMKILRSQMREGDMPA